MLDNGLTVHSSYSTMNMDFDWRLVRSFLAALEHGSLLGAARALGGSQPTIGRHIAELESQMNVVLFERTGRGLVPSDMALRLAESARAMEAAASELARRASGAQDARAGSVRISASQPVACGLLPPVLAQMRQALPDVQVELVASNEVSNLLRREADIALRMVQPEQASLVVRRIGRVTIGAYAHRDYLRRRGVPRTPAELTSHDLIGGDRNEDILRAGIGVGFISDHNARTDPAVVALLPSLKIPPLPLWLVVHREIRTSPRIRAVYDYLASAVAKAL